MSVEQSSTAVESKRALLKRIWEDKNVFNEDGWAKSTMNVFDHFQSLGFHLKWE